MKKYITLLFVVVCFAFETSVAQNITFKLINSATLEPIEGASLKSYLNKEVHVLSDKTGHLTVSLIENDTILISKDYFHPIYLFLSHSRFDTTHVLSISMIHSDKIHEVVKGDFSTLSDFNYHFVHDEIGEESFMKVRGFEHHSASEIRKDPIHTSKNPDGFHITPVLHQKHVGENQYSVK